MSALSESEARHNELFGSMPDDHPDMGRSAAGYGGIQGVIVQYHYSKSALAEKGLRIEDLWCEHSSKIHAIFGNQFKMTHDHFYINASSPDGYQTDDPSARTFDEAFPEKAHQRPKWLRAWIVSHLTR